MSNQKGLAPVFLIILVILGILVVILLYRRFNFQREYQQSVSKSSTFSKDSANIFYKDLQTKLKEAFK